MLVGAEEVCKITDFGMARDVHEEDIYVRTHEVIFVPLCIDSIYDIQPFSFLCLFLGSTSNQVDSTRGLVWQWSVHNG